MYRYVAKNPTNATDPDGLKVETRGLNDPKGTITWRNDQKVSTVVLGHPVTGNGVTIRYTGEKAAQIGFVQTFWTQIYVRYKGSDRRVLFDKQVTCDVRGLKDNIVRSIPKGDQPIMAVDAAIDTGSPTYSGIINRDPDHKPIRWIELQDLPTFLAEINDKAFAKVESQKNLAEVITLSHFRTYLILNKKPVAVVLWTAIARRVPHTLGSDLTYDYVNTYATKQFFKPDNDVIADTFPKQTHVNVDPPKTPK